MNSIDIWGTSIAILTPPHDFMAGFGTVHSRLQRPIQQNQQGRELIYKIRKGGRAII